MDSPLDHAKDQVLFQAYLHHPLPWRIEPDWTLEVRDDNGTVVAKSLTKESAEALIEWAEGQRDELSRVGTP